MMRKNRYLICLFVMGLTFVGARLSANSPGESDLLIAHGPYLQQPGPDSMTIVWFTNRNCFSWVEYGTGENFQTFPKWGSLQQTAVSSRHGLIDANITRHVVTLTDLEPGRAYPYRVVSREILQFEPYEVIYGNTVVGEINRFRTLDPGSPDLSFCVFQDVHGDADRLAGMLDQVSWDTIDLVFFNGDTLSHLESEKAIFDGFLDVCVDRFAGDVPLIYVRGNHDTRGILARRLPDYFPPRNSRYYYALDSGPVHFVVMDTGEDKPDDAPVYAGLADFDLYRETQAEWLRGEIESEAFRNADFRVVIFHIPPSGKGHGSAEVTRLWAPLLEKGGIDLLICGHLHRFSRIDPEPGRSSYPVIIGPAEGRIQADVSEGRLTLTVLDVEGKELDRVSISRR